MGYRSALAPYVQPGLGGRPAQQGIKAGGGQVRAECPGVRIAVAEDAAGFIPQARPGPAVICPAGAVQLAFFGAVSQHVGYIGQCVTIGYIQAGQSGILAEQQVCDRIEWHIIVDRQLFSPDSPAHLPGAG